MAYVVFPLLSLCTAFVFALFMKWYFNLRTGFFYKKCEGLNQGATHVLIEGQSGNKEVRPLKEPASDDHDKSVRKSCFEYRFIQFEFLELENYFKPIVFEVTGTHESVFDKFSQGICQSDANQLRSRFGACELEVPRKSMLVLLIDEVLNPFYIFQVFSMALWFWDGY